MLWTKSIHCVKMGEQSGTFCFYWKAFPDMKVENWKVSHTYSHIF